MPPSDGEPLAVGLARMEGKLDQVITDHERRLTAGETAEEVMHGRISAHGKALADHGARIGDLDRRTTGALGKVMSVVSPMIALAALSLTFIVWMAA